MWSPVQRATKLEEWGGGGKALMEKNLFLRLPLF